MRILFANGLSDSAVERLRAGGDTCALEPSLTAEQLPSHVAGFDALTGAQHPSDVGEHDCSRDVGRMVTQETFDA